MSEIRRIAILAEASFSALSAKTATGVIRYSPHQTVAVIDSTKSGKTVEEVLGSGGPIPIVGSIAETLAYQPQVLLIGIAPSGGQLPGEFRHVIREAIENGLDVWSGLHYFLSNDAEFSQLAARKGVRLWDVRRPGPDLRVGRAHALKTRALVVLAIGSDCNVGKMTAALELQKCAAARGYKAAFVATGQTGILIEGEGTPADAIAGDFISGEVERYVMQYDAEGADVIFVEGQGALLHPGYGPVTLGLMLGSMPDAFIMVHQPSRKVYRPGYEVALPPLDEIIDGYECVMRAYKAPRVLAIAVNTNDLSEEQARQEIGEIAALTKLPTTDPIRYGSSEMLFESFEPLLKAKLAVSAVVG